MKKIINNKNYDTETARVIGSNSYSQPRDFNWWSEILYCKRTGEYFLYGEGGPRSRYAEHVEQNCWRGGEKIIPLTYEEARKWAEENLTANEYEEVFGEVTENDSSEILTISLPASLVASLRRQAQEAGVSLSGLIASMLTK